MDIKSLTIDEIKNLTGACGMDCFNCIVYEKNIDDETINRLAKLTNKPTSAVPCKGCRNGDGGCPAFMKGCATLSCVKKKGLEFCYECSDFPCDRLIPCKDSADRLPHNFKLYNSCQIKKLGLIEWSKKATKIRQKYFEGKLVLGVGPILENKKD